MQRRLVLAFILSLFWTIYLPLHMPSIRFCTFCPILALIALEYSCISSIWISMGLGFLLATLSYTGSIGITSLSYALSMFIMHRFRRMFSQDSYLILYSILMAASTTFIQMLFLKIFFIQTIFIDVFLLSIFDGIYAYLGVFLPLNLYKYLSNKENLRYFASFCRKWHTRIMTRKG